MSKSENPCKAILDVRFRFLNIWESVSVNGSEPRYNVGCLINKSDEKTVSKMKKAFDAAKESYLSKYGEINEDNFKSPIKDGDNDENFDDTFKNCFFINANSKYNAPEIVDGKLREITDRTIIRPGDYGKISVIFYPYNTKDGAGVAALLGNLQFIAKGVPIFERATAKDEFEEVTVDEVEKFKEVGEYENFLD